MLIDKTNPAHAYLEDRDGDVLVATIQHPDNVNLSYVTCSPARAQELKAMTDEELDVYGLRSVKDQIQAAKLT